MLAILTRAGCFIAIILLGFLLRKAGLVRDQDFPVLSNLVIKVTLPASIIAGFAGKQLDPTLLSLAVIGLLADVIHMGAAWVLNRRKSKEQLAFDMINTPGYSIGTFTMPFVQSFLGPAGVIAVSLFDVGNACICLGTTCSISKTILSGSGFSLKRTGLSLLKSVPFVCYIIMVILNLAHISLPAPVISFAEIIGNANAFLAMFMIGVGLKLNFKGSQLGRIFRILAVRLGLAVILSLLCWFCLPFDRITRLVLVIMFFSPIGSTAPAFTGEVKGDVGLASAVNSVSIIISIVIIVTLMVTIV